MRDSEREREYSVKVLVIRSAADNRRRFQKQVGHSGAFYVILHSYKVIKHDGVRLSGGKDIERLSLAAIGQSSSPRT